MRFVIAAACLFAFVCPAAGSDALISTQDHAPADTDFGRVVLDSFPPPSAGSVMGVDWVPSHGFMYLANEVPGEIFEVHADGTAFLLADLEAQTGHTTHANGVCFVDHPEGGIIYVNDYNGQTSDRDPIYFLTELGAIVDSVDVHSFSPGTLGITFDGAFFWLSSDTDGTIIRCTESFVPVDVYPHPSGSITGGGLDFDPMTGRIYALDWFTGIVYVCDMGMNVIDAFPTVENDGSFCGITIGRLVRSRNLWITDFEHEMVYEAADIYFSPVEPSSWSSIKAIFR